MRNMILLILLVLIGVLPVVAQDEQPLSVNDIAWSPDGRLLAVATSQGVIVYKVEDDGFKRVWSADLSRWVNAVVFSPSGDQLAAGTMHMLSESDDPLGGMIYVWNSESGVLSHRFEGNDSGVYSLAFDIYGSQLAVGGGDFYIHNYDYLAIWQLGESTERLLLRISSFVGIVQAMAFSPDGHWFAYSSQDGATTFLEVSTWTPVAAIYEVTDEISFDLSENPSTHVWLGEDRAEEWEFHDTPEIYLVRTNPIPIVGYSPLPFSNDAMTIGATETWFVSATNDGVLRAGLFESSRDVAVHVRDGISFTKGVFNSEETQIVLMGNDKSRSRLGYVFVWTLNTGEFISLNLEP